MSGRHRRVHAHPATVDTTSPGEGDVIEPAQPFIAADFGANWLERFHCGDPRALREAFDSYAGMVHGIGLARSGSSRIADDLVIRVFARAWATRDAFDPRLGSGPLRSWLLQLALRLLPPLTPPGQPVEDRSNGVLSRSPISSARES